MPEWRIENGLVDYAHAVSAMEARADGIARGEADELIWLVEHPPLYTAGTSAKDADLIAPERFPVFKTGRGGEYTYHGPGQRVAYLMIDLARRGRDVRAFIAAIENWVVVTLEALGIESRTADGRVGVWTDTPAGEAKIAAIGIRLRRWVSFHGLAINVAPDLEHFSGIVPCGLADFGVTSLSALGKSASFADVDRILRHNTPFD